MNYREAIDFIKDKGKFGSKLGLDVMSSLLHKIGDPQKSFKCVHIAGTNGKGSTSSFVRNILTSSGYKVGLFSSPPIISETERIQIDGKFIPKRSLAAITGFIKPFADEVEKDGLHYPTEFELFTAIAFEYFKRMKVDIAVIEVGMGGKLDATNVCIPAVSVITNIGLDHTEWLGDTLEKIAAEKAGIIKKDVPAVLYPDVSDGVRDVVACVCKGQNAMLYDSSKAEVALKTSDISGNIFDYRFNDFILKNAEVKLLGVHQVKNSTTAITAALVLKANGFDRITEHSIREGLANTSWPGRFEIRSRNPLIIFDGGHNEQCLGALADCVDRYLQNYRKILVFSMFADKDCRSSVKLLKNRFDDRIICQMKHKRRAEADYICSLFDEPTTVVLDPSKALKTAVKMAEKYEKNGVKSAVVVCGSLNLLEEILAE